MSGRPAGRPVSARLHERAAAPPGGRVSSLRTPVSGPSRVHQAGALRAVFSGSRCSGPGPALQVGRLTRLVTTRQATWPPRRAACARPCRVRCDARRRQDTDPLGRGREGDVILRARCPTLGCQSRCPGGLTGDVVPLSRSPHRRLSCKTISHPVSSPCGLKRCRRMNFLCRLHSVTWPREI